MSRGRDDAGTAEKNEGRTKIDDKENHYAEDDCRIGKSHQSSGGAPAAFDGIGKIGIKPVDRDIHQANSSNQIPQERTTNARRHEVIVPRRGKQDFRGVRKKPGALQVHALVERKDQRCHETEEADRTIEHGERKSHVENRNPEEQEIDRGKKQPGIGTVQQHNVNQIERQTERGNEIEDDKVQPLKRIRQAFKSMEKSQFAIHHEANSQGIAIPARALAQKAYAARRAGRFRPGVRYEPDSMAEPTQPQAELEILSGSDVQPALPQEYVAPIHRAGTGETGDR